MRRPAITTRRLMVLVLGIGLLMGLGLPAWDVFRDREPHVHIWVAWGESPLAEVFKRHQGAAYKDPRKSYHAYNDLGISSPFWPRYWRHLRGLPWKKQPVCRPARGQFELFCEWEHSEFVSRRPRITSISYPQPVQEAVTRLRAAAPPMPTGQVVP